MAPTFDDVPRRFVALLIQAVLDQRASMAGLPTPLAST